MIHLKPLCIGALLLVITGCAATYELSDPPPGHPANPHVGEPTYERSTTLAEADPVDPRPAKSYQWTPDKEMNTDHYQHTQKEKPDREIKDTHEQVPDSFEGQLAQVLRAYFGIADALAADDFKTATNKVELMQTRLKQADPKLLDEAKREQWNQINKAMGEALQRFLHTPALEAARTAFESISGQMEKSVRTFGSGDLAPVYVLHCPMAFGNRGAHWLQPYERVNNPYYGARMLRCGSVTDTLVPVQEDKNKHNHNH